MRKACLNIAMSMKGDGKPVSFIEDCAVRLEDLAGYTDRLTRVIERHGSRGTWYAHASVGTLHVRPILNLKQAVLPDGDAAAVGGAVLLLEEFLDSERAAGHLDLPLRPIGTRRALLHGHCHQKSFGALPAVGRVADLVPDLDVATIDSSCCGMAGGFGYQAETIAVSRGMAELSLLPAVRAADADTMILADGTSCRHQIADGTGRTALHVADLLDRALAPAVRTP